ncbi:MAG: flagellar basal body P-ring formation chaperone FlgA [Longimicrobiales bacterium]
MIGFSPVRVGAVAVLTLVALASVGGPAHARQAMAVGSRAAADVVAERVAPELGVVPDRVRVEWPGDAVADSVLLTGAGPGRWIATAWNAGLVTRRYVRVGVERDVPVAARALPRDHVIAPEDVRVEPRVLWGVGALSVAEVLDPIDRVTSRMLEEGAVLEAPAVQLPLLVHGGDEVEAVLEQPGVVMRIRAEALGSARRGESVYVRLTSGKRMAARAVDRGVVRLILGGA